MGQDKFGESSVFLNRGEGATGGDDDVEGHRMGKPAASGGDDDVEGHRMGKPAASGGDDELDPEGRTRIP